MAELQIHSRRIIENIKKLNSFFQSKNMQWSLVTKILSGYKPVLEKILEDDEILNLHSIGDARMSNLKVIKSIKPDLVTMYIKPPAQNQIKSLVKYADISLNTNIETIKLINKEALNQGVKHRVIIMIEMGELREGVMRDNVLGFYEDVFKLEGIEVIGLGTNLGCMYGVEPTYDKLIQLYLYKKLIEVKFGKELPFISGGSSITLPLLTSNKVPPGLNHFRIGETAFLGVSPYNGKKFKNLSTNAFDFSAEILEFEKKGNVPDGNIGDGAIGIVDEDKMQADYHETWRCIVDFGEIDVDVNNLLLKDNKIQFVGTTSDMTVYELLEDAYKYKVGDKIHFVPNYMAVARLTNSKYMTKVIK